MATRKEYLAFILDQLSLLDGIMHRFMMGEYVIYPAYHMSKAHWLTVALDGAVDDDKLQFLLDMSYELTKRR